MSEFLRDFKDKLVSKRALGLTMGALTLGAAGCGQPVRAHGEGMRLEDNGNLIFPGESPKRFSTISCAGPELIIDIENNNEYDSSYQIVNDSVCADGKLTPSDFQPR